MDRYFIMTNKGYIITNDQLLSMMPFTLDEMITNPSVLDHPTDKEPDIPYKVLYVTKNDKDYWEFGEYV